MQMTSLHDIDPLPDVLVIGAGPAGALAARQLAERGLSLLLVDKQEFPRHKICGCCLSSRALQSLELIGLSSAMQELGAVPLKHLQLAAGERKLQLALTNSSSVSRRAFDHFLTEAAIACGAQFLAHTSARVMALDRERPQVLLGADGGEQVIVAPRLVLVADGLGGSSLLGHHDLTPNVQPNSRLGTGMVLEEAPAFYEKGTIYMAYSSTGYLGLVRLEDGSLNLAAAFDADFVKEYQHPAKAAAATLRQCHWPVPESMLENHWKGTAPLTRKRPKLAARHLFIIGDAAGYVEPFTGEGIAWALASAQAVIPLALEAVAHWSDAMEWRWQHTWQHLLGQRHAMTRAISYLLKQYPATLILGDLMNRLPGLGQLIASKVSGSWNEEELEWLHT